MTSRQHARHTQPARSWPARFNTLTTATWRKIIAVSLAATSVSAAAASPIVLAESRDIAAEDVTLIAKGSQESPVPAEDPVPFVASADVASVPFVQLPTVSVSADELDDELVQAVNEAAQTLSRVSGSENGVSGAAEDLIATLDEQGPLVAASLNKMASDAPVEAAEVVEAPVLAAQKESSEEAAKEASGEVSEAGDAARAVISRSASAAPSESEDIQSQQAQDPASTAIGTVAAEHEEVEVPTAKEQSKLASRILVQIEAVKSESPSVVDVFYQRPEVDKRATLEAAAHQFVPGNYVNGELPTSELCVVSGGTMRCDAAAMFTLMNQDFAAEFGHDIGIVSSYRTYSQQVAVKASRGHFAAIPGTSNHGLGLALDLSGQIARFGTAERSWIVRNGPSYGWIAPDWAAQGGSKPEPWHYEFVGAPEPSKSSEMWTYYDRVDRDELAAVVQPYKLSIPRG